MAPKRFVAAAFVAAALALLGGAQTSKGSSSGASAASADVVVDWNMTMVDALMATATAPQPGTRIAAIVQTAVFDAVNGITGRYTQYRPDAIGATAPPGASVEAAAVGAAYTTLVALLPSQLDRFNAQRDATLATNNGQSVDRGFAWGVTVANAILALRATDGFTTPPGPYTVLPLPYWQPAPPLGAGPVQRQFAHMTPWAMTSSDQFDPGPPPTLSSSGYLQDFNEVKSLGSSASTTRTADQAQAAQFWQGKFDTVVTLWNRVAESFTNRPDRSLTENARLFALMDIAMADSVIAVWNAKNEYNTWRPITAIQNAGVYGDAGVADPSWTPFMPTPAHQEYPSGHSGNSGAAAAVLASFFGSNTSFDVSSDGVPGVPSTVRSFSSFSDALDEIAIARIVAGFHFRFACEIAMHMGQETAAQAMATQMLPLQGKGNGGGH
jgi:membrane-associated phospholipid phosphatase